MAFNENRGDNLDELVKLMGSKHAAVNQFITLLTPANVNLLVGLEPLIMHYLRSCSRANLAVLTAFATNGCNFNVQGKDGQTPLHLLIKMANSVAVEVLLSHGADPLVVDSHGNNVLMAAVSLERDSLVEYLLAKDKAVVSPLITQKNQEGHDVLALLLVTEDTHINWNHLVEPLKRLVQLGADFTTTDNNGHNCLHHLARGSGTGVRAKAFSTELRKVWFRVEDRFSWPLEVLLEAGADKCQQNKRGLIRLQVALSSERFVFETVFQLEALVPDEHVLEQLVPCPSIDTMVKEPSNSDVQLWLVGQMVKYGFRSPEHALSLVKASKYYSIEVIRQLVLKRGVKPTPADVKISCLNGNWKEVEVYVKNMLPQDINDIKLVIPDIVNRIISIDGRSRFTNFDLIVILLVTNGLAITVNDLKVALAKNYAEIVKKLITKMDSSFEDEVKQELPDILTQVLRMFMKFKYFSMDEVQNVVKKIFIKFKISVNYVNNYKDSVIQCILDIAGKGLLTETDTMKLFDFFSTIENVNVEQTVRLERTVCVGNNSSTEMIELRPVDWAIEVNKFEVAIKLILVGANCHGIEYCKAKRNPAAIKLLKLLYHLGIYVDVAEGDVIYSWAQSKTLQELAAMVVCRNYTGNEITEAIKDIELPVNVKKYLELKLLNLDH